MSPAVPLTELRQLLPPGPLLLAYSGGLDSRVLLAWLVALRHADPGYSLRAVHVHHGLSPNADAWAAHCQQICDTHAVPLEVVRLRLTCGPRQSLEAVARQARYGALAARLAPGERLLTAHHQDDQLETLLLALKRGAGPRGLAAMGLRQAFAGGELIRPLLSHGRAELAAWANAAGLSWIEDESNADQGFDRNFLRHAIVPLLQARWPGFAQAASRSARLCAEQEALAEELAVADLALCRGDGASLALAPLASLSEPRRHNLLRHWLRQQTGAVPSEVQLHRLWPQLVEAQPDATPALHWAGGTLYRYADALHQVAPQPALPAGTRCLTVNGLCRLPADLGWAGLRMCDGGELRLPSGSEPVSLRWGLPGGSRLRPLGRGGSRPLKKLWQELGVAPWLRGRWPVLYYGEVPVAIVGKLVCEAGAPRSGEARAELIWAPPGA